MNHKSWKRSLESSLNVVSAKQPRFAEAVLTHDNQMPQDKKIPVMNTTIDTFQKNIVLPAMQLDKKTALSVRRYLVNFKIVLFPA